MYYTVQELLAQIKGWEYIIAIMFLGLFLAAWLAISQERPRRRQLLEVPVGHQTPPCWESQHCPPEVRERCPAYALSPLPCWVARPLVEGRRMESCTTCPIYAKGTERVIEAVKKKHPTYASSEVPPTA